MKHEDEIVSVESKEGWVVFYNFLQEEVLRVKPEVAEALKVYYTWGTDVRVDTAIDTLQNVIIQLENLKNG